MDVGLFLGAGASVYYGYPTTKALKEKLLKHYPSHDNGIEHKLLKSEYLYDIEYVLDLLIKFDQFFNIEHINNFFGNMEIRSIDPSNIATLHRRINKMKLFIERSIFENYGWNNKYHDDVKNMFGVLYNKINNKNLHIFTTNYDRAIEKFCEKNGIECCDGFDATDVGKNIYKNNFKPKSNNYLRLYKLHGSLSWRKDDNEIMYVDVDEMGKNNNRNLLIYPTLSPKEEEENYPYRDYVDEFKKFTSKNNICVVIGFSFRDFQKEFLELLENGGHLIIVSKDGYNNFVKECEPNEDYSLHDMTPHRFKLITKDTPENPTKFTCTPNSVYICPENLLPENVERISQEILDLTNKIIQECNTTKDAGF